LIIGYDTRFFSDRYAMVTADVIRGNGIPVIISDRPISTPVLSYSVKSLQCLRRYYDYSQP